MTALQGPGTTAAAEAARQARAGGRPVLDIRSFGTASGAPPDHVREAVARAAREPRAGSSSGLPELREAIAAKLSTERRGLSRANRQSVRQLFCYYAATEPSRTTPIYAGRPQSQV
jgi:aspartate/methionine/tyrosine aminotransferase